MKAEKYEQKIKKKYGVTKEELKDLSISKIKNLKVNEKNLQKENSKFKLVRKPIKTIVKGATIGASVAGVVNTVFPNLVPVLGTHLNALSNNSNTSKIFNDLLLSSAPVDIISGYGIIGLGGAIGVLSYSTYKLIKITTNNLSIISDRKKAKKLSK